MDFSCGPLLKEEDACGPKKFHAGPQPSAESRTHQETLLENRTESYNLGLPVSGTELLNREGTGYGEQLHCVRTGKHRSREGSRSRVQKQNPISASLYTAAIRGA